MAPKTHPCRKRRTQLRTRYNLSPDQYDALLFAQGGVCAICGREETRRTRSGKTHNLCVDHNHETGEVRGLLCQACNTGLGRFEDRPGRLLDAALYLVRRN